MDEQKKKEIDKFLDEWFSGNEPTKERYIKAMQMMSENCKTVDIDNYCENIDCRFCIVYNNCNADCVDLLGSNNEPQNHENFQYFADEFLRRTGEIRFAQILVHGMSEAVDNILSDNPSVEEKQLHVAIQNAEKILAHFGVVNQVNKLIEEITELHNDMMEDKSLTPELADVLSIALQLYTIDPILRAEVARKQQRTIERYDIK